jgi:hypothetical protein
MTLNTVMLSVVTRPILLSVVMPSVLMLNVIMQGVVAPLFTTLYFPFSLVRDKHSSLLYYEEM